MLDLLKKGTVPVLHLDVSKFKLPHTPQVSSIRRVYVLPHSLTVLTAWSMYEAWSILENSNIYIKILYQNFLSAQPVSRFEYKYILFMEISVYTVRAVYIQYSTLTIKWIDTNHITRRVAVVFGWWEKEGGLGDSMPRLRIEVLWSMGNPMLTCC